ncbi:MAG: hypothetical protein CMJ38_05935 [Phycisphaerae bacterium]|nr:hypothetical protein [Phycisphaerae bacterium]
MVESELAVRRLLDSDWALHSILLSPQKHERLATVLEGRALDVFVADVSLMSEVTGFHIHRGVLAAVQRNYRKQSLESIIERKQTSSLLLAEGITNIDNMGSLFRNATAFGVDGVLLSRTCCDPLYRKSIRVSMGHVFSIPWIMIEDWESSIQQLKETYGVQLIGLETGPDAVPLWEVDVSEHCGIIVGEEKAGLSPATLKLCDVIAEIPMSASVPSINVGVASAVGLYDLVLRNRLNSR